MINKIKSISKRTLSLILTLLMLLSSGIVGALAANVDFVETGANKVLAETKATGYLFYLCGSGNDWGSAVGNSSYQFIEQTDGTFKMEHVSSSLLGSFKIVYKNGNDQWWFGRNEDKNVGGTDITDSNGKYTVPIGKFAASGHGANIEISDLVSGNYTLIYTNGNATTAGELTLELEEEEIIKNTESRIYLKGGFNEWTDSTPMLYKEDDNSNLVYVDLELSANTEYEFKVHGDAWYSYNGTITVGSTNILSSSVEGNAKLKTSTATTYRFEFDNATKNLTITEVQKHQVTISNSNNFGVFKINDQSYSDGSYSAQITEGTELKVYCKSDTNYYISSFLVNDSEKANDESYFKTKWYEVEYTFTVNEPLDIEFTHQNNPIININYDSNMGSVEVKKFNNSTATNGGSVDYGYDLTYTISPKDNHKVSAVTVNGTPYDTNLSGTIESVTENINFTVTFEPVATYSFTVTPTIEGVATIKVEGSIDDKTVSHGAVLTLSLENIFDSHKFIKWVIKNGDGEEYEVTTETATLTVAGEVTVKLVLAERIFHTIAISQEDNTGGQLDGTITTTVGEITNNQLTLEEGTEVVLTVNAPAGYYISKLNGTANTVESKTSDTVSYTVDDDKTLEVEYTKKSTFTVTVINSNPDAGSFVITTTDSDTTVSSDTATGYAGGTFTIEATKKSGYYFKSYAVEGTEKTTNPYTHNITCDTVITIYWEKEDWKSIVYVEDQVGVEELWAYTYDKDDHEYNGTWGGTRMAEYTTVNGNPVYAVEVPADADAIENDNVKIMFHKGDTKYNGDNGFVLESDVNYYILSNNNTISKNSGTYKTFDFYLIFLDNGANKHYQENGVGEDITIAQMSVNQAEEGVKSFNSELIQNHRYNKDNVRIYYDTGYYTATVYKGMSVNLTATVDKEYAPEYKVKGFLINGTHFEVARDKGNGVYEASYTFENNCSVVVPIYSYTDEFIRAEGLAEITLYAEIPKEFNGEWGKYMAAYVWYDKYNADTQTSDKTNTDYIFGAWPGQLMIPVEGYNNYWYTTVTATSPNDYPASGVTFSNYGGWESTAGVLYPVTNSTNIQVYDYYEFITLAEQKSENITFVLKNGEDDNDTGEGLTIDDADFVDYVDISNKTIDVYGKKINSDAEIGLYVIRNAPVASIDNPLSGYYYVECSLYKPNGDYIGNCFSYELLEIDKLAERLDSEYLKDLSGKRVRVDYEIMTHMENGDENYADRYDGQWYNAVLESTIKVNVALTNNNGENYTITSKVPANADEYGKATVAGGESIVVKRGEEVTLTALKEKGYKFIAWYNSEGQLISKDSQKTIKAAKDEVYTAVFQELKSGEFVVTHEIYKSDLDIPIAHGGRADLYIGIENTDTNERFAFSKTNQGSIQAKAGDELIITIGTNPLGADKFFAWYVEAVDKHGNNTYEEVGVDNYTGDGYGNLHPNGSKTVIGSNEMVYFQFKYVVKEDLFNISLYSDLTPVSAEATLIYYYENRYGDNRQYIKKYTLSDEEIEGFDGNHDTPYRPSDENIEKYAPYVEDLYKDTTWSITDIDENEFSLWADQPDTQYKVTVNVGNTTKYFTGTFNTEVEIKGKDFNKNLSNSGFWYSDDGDGVYEEGIDTIVGYGTYYGLRITDNMILCYEEVEELDFMINIAEPVYGREQNTDKDGGNVTDFIYVDYMTSIFVPFFKGDTVNGQKINIVYYNDDPITSNNNPVTIETLTKLDYKFDYGIILEQLNTAIVKIDDVWGKVPLTQEELEDVIEGEISGLYSDNTRYITYNSAITEGFVLTNKNRYLHTFTLQNTEINRNKYFNVYGYLVVTDPSTDEKTYYFSDMQKLNILEIGTSEGIDQFVE